MISFFGLCEADEAERPRADDSGLREKAPADPRRDGEKRPPSRTWRWLLNGAQPEPLQSYGGTVEDPEPGKVGICCSGGGIRSAAFSLGALQALGVRGELRRAAYLAAVSGGSYIAAAISTVAKTGERDSDPTLIGQRDAFAPGTPEEHYLRNRSSYLAPTAGDKVYLAWRIVLGLLLNLLFVSTPLIGATLILTGVLYAPLLPHLAGACGEHCTASPPIWFPWIPLGVLVASALMGCATLLLKLRPDGRERFFTVWTTRLLVIAATLGVVFVGLPYLVEWLSGAANVGESLQPSVGKTIAALGTGFAGLLAGLAAQLTHLLRTKDAAAVEGQARSLWRKLGSGARLALAYLAGAVIGPLLLLGVVAATFAVAIAQAPPDGSIDVSLIWIGGAVLAGFAAIYPWMDLTSWSLHPFYKRRLSSAFSLKRVSPVDLSPRERKRVEALMPPAVGSELGVAVERDFNEPVSLSRTALSETRGNKWPTLLVCAAANVSDPGATPPGRHVTSFTFSSQTVGGPLVGAVRTWELETAFESREEAFPPDPSEAGAKAHGARRRRSRDLTLIAAVAMSGAAISPSMGKMTKRPLTFLMTLANIRLGVWVPNPRWVGELERRKRLRRYFARPRPWYLLCEMLGRNRIGSKYLYVTDGGHYENLGLVELLRRGCTEVYCFDASGVGQGRAEFEALGDAIALARSELQVEVDFGDIDPEDLTPDPKTRLAKTDVIRGKITYPNGGPTGTLLYVRNTMTDRAPWDARAYQKADPRFPHNPTVDQLYTDQKFEAYRVLGARAATRAFEQMKAV